jgi:hypothetical protein
MAKRVTPLAFRLPDDLLAGVDSFVAIKNKETPGLGWTRSDGVRVLLTEALSRHKKVRA